MRSSTVSSRLLAANTQSSNHVLRCPRRVCHLLVALWRACLAMRPTAVVRLCRRVCGLGLFILFWHLMTMYEVTFYVRFLNIPGPVEVLAEMAETGDERTVLYAPPDQPGADLSWVCAGSLSRDSLRYPGWLVSTDG